MAYVLSMWLLMFGAVPEPRVLSPEPVPGRARIIGRGPSGAWMISYNNSGGPEEEASLRVGGTWQRVPDGTAHEWRDWVVIEGLVALEGRDKLPEGATFSFSFGVLPWFARRVVLVNLRSGQRIDAPWDTLSPQPLGDGTRWLLMRCREATAELMLWTPSTNEAATLATLEADLSTRCKSFGGGSLAVAGERGGAYMQVAGDSGGAWAFVDATGHLERGKKPPRPHDVGKSLRPFKALQHDHHTEPPYTAEGRELRGELPGGGSTSLTGTDAAGFIVHDGFLLADQGVYRLPPKTTVVWGWPPALVLPAEPLPGRFTGLSRGPSGVWLVQYGASSEFGGARQSMLRLGGQWVPVPAGAVFEWGPWLVFEGLEPQPRTEDEEAGIPLPAGASYSVGLGTDDVFARRVTLIERRTGQRIDAPWDTMAPFPLGDGQHWLLWRCRRHFDKQAQRVDKTFELLLWTPSENSVRALGLVDGDLDSSCSQRSAAENGYQVTTFPPGGVETPTGRQTYLQSPAIVPDKHGALARLATQKGVRWVLVDGGGQTKPVPPPSATPAGAVLRPFVELEVIRDDKATPRVNGRVARGGGGARGSGGSVPLTPSLSSGFAVHDGFLFAEEGVFRLPKGAKVSFAPPGSQ